MTSVDKYSNIFTSELDNVKIVLKEINEFIFSIFPNISYELQNELRLIFSELLVNAVIHGNNMDNSKEVFVTVSAYDDVIESVIKDEGRGFDYLDLLDEVNSKTNISENGRGVFLVYNLTDSLLFNTLGNEIAFMKKVKESYG